MTYKNLDAFNKEFKKLSKRFITLEEDFKTFKKYALETFFGDTKLDTGSFVKIEGRWTSHIEFDGDEYWNVDDYKLLGKYDDGFILPSDGRYREDLKFFIKDDEENSQKEKEKLEELQRKDRKLRKEWIEKNKILN